MSTTPPEAAAPAAEGLNRHVEDFLSYYIGHKVSPGYAVLLKGKWGSGKTWFLKDFIKRNGHRSKVIFVSLYGVSSFEEIESEFFRQLHPVLSSKGMMLAGRVLKGFLKAGISIDLSKDIEGSMENALPDINLPDYLTQTKNSVLIFDDVERCAIPILELLGYVNQFVEVDGYKAILVANEDEIAKPTGQGDDVLRKEYERVKEKLIGKTFVIEADHVSAISSFLDLVQDSRSKHLLEKNKTAICAIYVASKSENLRHVRQMILDVDRLIPNLHSNLIGEAELMAHFLGLYLIYSTEIRNGNIKASDIVTGYQARLSAAMGQRQKPAAAPGKFLAVAERYGEFPLDEILLTPDLWAKLLEDSRDVYAEIDEALRNSSYLQSKDRPVWVRLWHHNHLSDEEVSDLVRELASEFDTFESNDLGVIRHMFGLLLKFSTIGVHDKAPDELLATGKQYVDQVRARGRLPLGEKKAFGIFDTGGYAGLGYAAADRPEFQALTTYIRDQAEHALEEARPEEARALLADMEVDPNKFFRGVNLTNGGENRFYNVPILLHIKPEDFFASVIKLNGDGLHTVGSALEERYHHDQFVGGLLVERPFLEQVRTMLQEEVARRPRTLSGHELGKFADVLSNIIRKLDRRQPGPKPVG